MSHLDEYIYNHHNEWHHHGRHPDRAREQHLEHYFSPLKIQLERLWTDYYFMLRQWAFSAKIITSLAPNNEALVLEFARQLGWNLGRLLRLGEREVQLIISIIRQYIEMGIRIIKSLFLNQNIDVLYTSWKDIIDVLVDYIHRHLPSIRRRELRRLFYIHLHSLQTEAIAILSNDASRINIAGSESLEHLRAIIEYLQRYLY